MRQCWFDEICFVYIFIWECLVRPNTKDYLLFLIQLEFLPPFTSITDFQFWSKCWTGWYHFDTPYNCIFAARNYLIKPRYQFKYLCRVWHLHLQFVRYSLFCAFVCLPFLSINVIFLIVDFIRPIVISSCAMILAVFFIDINPYAIMYMWYQTNPFRSSHRIFDSIYYLLIELR